MNSCSTGFSSLTHQAASIVKTVCSCIETPSTSLTTTTDSSVSTAYTTVTNTQTSTSTSTTTTHVTITTTTTTTVQPTHTHPACTGGEVGDEEYTAYCGYQVSSTDPSQTPPGDATDISSCLDLCNNFNTGTTINCAASFQVSSSVCTCYIHLLAPDSGCAALPGSANSDYDIAVYEPLY